MVRNPPPNAGDMGLIPGLGAPAVGQLSLRAATTEPVLCNKRSHCNEKEAHGLQLEKVHTQQENALQPKKQNKTKQNKTRGACKVCSQFHSLSSQLQILIPALLFSVFLWIELCSPPKDIL